MLHQLRIWLPNGVQHYLRSTTVRLLQLARVFVRVGVIGLRDIEIGDADGVSHEDRGSAKLRHSTARPASLRLLALAAFAAGVPAISAVQQPATWRLEAARVSIGGDALPLHRVCGAGFLPDGKIVIADAGNVRMLIASADGRLEKSFGRKGAGPGEFDSILSMHVAGDTILTYDSGLRRVTQWSRSGALIGTAPIAATEGATAEYRGAFGASDFLVSEYRARVTGPSGLTLDTVQLLRATRQRSTAQFPRFPWSYTYLYSEPDGSAATGYRTPFLGETKSAVVDGFLVVVPLGTSQAQVFTAAGVQTRIVPLPTVLRPSSRTAVNAYRDSLLEASRAVGALNPRSEDRIRRVFGDGFPVPPSTSVADAVAVVGARVWIRLFQAAPRGTSTWVVVDPAVGVVTARLELPSGHRVLGGSDRAVLVHSRNADGEELVAIHGIAR